MIYLLKVSSKIVVNPHHEFHVMPECWGLMLLCMSLSPHAFPTGIWPSTTSHGLSIITRALGVCHRPMVLMGQAYKAYINGWDASFMGHHQVVWVAFGTYCGSLEPYFWWFVISSSCWYWSGWYVVVRTGKERDRG